MIDDSVRPSIMELYLEERKINERKTVMTGLLAGNAQNLSL